MKLIAFALMLATIVMVAPLARGHNEALWKQCPNKKEPSTAKGATKGRCF